MNRDTATALPLVTVYIPCYNQGSVVARAIQSVLNQDYTNLEIIISDDSSPDHTAQAVAPFLKDPRVRYERAPHNIGRVANYRRGLMELARGEWYINLDGDDYYDNPSYISKAVKMALEKPDSVLIFGRQKYYDAESQVLSTKPPPAVAPWTAGKQFLLNYFSNNDGIPHMSALYRVSIARQAGLFLNDIVFADAEAMLRLLPWGWVGYCGEFSGVWIYHGKNDSYQLSIDLRLQNLTAITAPADFFVQQLLLTPEQAQRWKMQGLKRLIREGLHFYLDHFCYRLAFQFWYRATSASKSFSWPLGERLAIWFHWRVLLRLVFPWFSQIKHKLKGFL